MKSLIVSIILISNPVFAAGKINRAEINKSLSDITSVPLVHEGKQGVWFPAESADVVLQLIETTLPIALRIIDSQAEQILYLKDANLSYKTAIVQYKQVGDLNKEMYKIAMENLPKFSSLSPPWFDTTTAWFIYGIVVGVATIALASWVLDNVQVQ